MLIGIREIEEKYDVLAKLGEGGMGAVYKARHKLLDEMRVIKTIKPQLQSDADLQARFLREAQVAAKMSHPNIATLHDFAFTADGTAYIVMQHVDGHNLRDYQRQGGKLSIAQVVEIGSQALDALGYLHSKSFVHRDISTDNLMIGWPGESPRVTLIDLGLAKSLGGSDWRTKTGMVVGKVRYISPEQLNSGVSGVEVDARSDLYSFGVVLYELLTGEYPITGADDMSLIAGHLYRAPRPFEETDPRDHIPAPLRTVVMKALEKNAEYRFATAEEFADGLRSALDPRKSVVDTATEATVILSDGDIPSSSAPGDPHRATETIGVQVDPQVTRPAVAPGDAPFTRAAVPRPGKAKVGTVAAGFPTRPVPTGEGEVGSPAGVAPEEGAPHATVQVDHEAKTARLEVDDLAPTRLDVHSVAPGVEPSTARSGPLTASPASAPSEQASPGSGRAKIALAAVVLGLLLAVGLWWFLGRDKGPAGSSTSSAAALGVASPDGATTEGAAGADGAAVGSDAGLGPIFWGDYHAVVIGNNDYQSLPQLETALRDAREVARVLETKYGFQVTLVENADRKQLMDAVWSVAGNLTVRQNLLIYYAGHGALADRAPFWQPVDADPSRLSNWISTEFDVAGNLERIQARHVLVVSDSCFAGAMGGEALTGQGNIAAGASGAGMRELVRRQSRLVLASGGLAPVLDAGGGGHSIFARAFLDVLEANQGPLGVEDLYGALSPKVEAAARGRNFEQQPVLAPIPHSSDEGGEFFFVPKEYRSQEAGT